MRVIAPLLHDQADGSSPTGGDRDTHVWPTARLADRADRLGARTARRAWDAMGDHERGRAVPGQGEALHLLRTGG